VHLHVHSPFSFLDGAGRIECLVRAAAACGLPALALTDHDGVSGAVRFTRACHAAGIRPLLGAEVTEEGGYHLVLLADGPEGYANLCRILTRAHLDHPRGAPRVTQAVLAAHSEHLYALSGCRRGRLPALILRRRYRDACEAALAYRRIFGARFYIELVQDFLPGNLALTRSLRELAAWLKLPVVATNNVHYVAKEDFPVHDLLTCIRFGITLEEAHPARRLNAENYLKPPAVMRALFKDCPEACENTVRLAEACRPALPQGMEVSPRFPVPAGEAPAGLLRRLVEAGARERYGRLTPAIRERLAYELEVITGLGFADYFLIAWDVVRYARARGIRCAGRGSAADSAVAYCLGITEVDPIERHLLFERFLNPARPTRPDIDLDFDARRRDEVAAYMRARYGAERVAGVATYQTFQARSALRDLGKAMGLAMTELEPLIRRMPYVRADAIEAALEQFPELRAATFRDPRYHRLYRFCAAVAGFPRHLGTHLGGLVLAGVPLEQVTPLVQAAKGMAIVPFDKDDVEDLGLFKFDLLSLRALSAVEEAVRIIRKEVPAFDFDRLPLDDAATYAMLHRGKTVGVFQLESPAQRALQLRLRAVGIEDVIASVALIRPGPIKGNMVEPYLDRRHGREPVSYPHPALEPVLKKTYGVLLFQEQVIALAAAVAGFSYGEADRLRRVLGKSRTARELQEIGEAFVSRAAARGVEENVARQVFAWVEGYAGYGFCEAHAAAFGLTAYKTAYLACHYPAAYFAALMNNQPMGYYPPQTLAVVARSRGVAILPPDINRSGAAFTVEGNAIRIPLSRVKGMRRHTLSTILKAREEGPFTSFTDFTTRVRCERDTLVNLVLCGAFDALNPNRRALLARLQAGTQEATLFDAEEDTWPDFSPGVKRQMEYAILGMDVSRHFMAHLRARLQEQGYTDTAALEGLPDGTPVRIAGFPVRPHRPPTRSGRTVVFFTLEDEHGLADVTVFEDCYHRTGWILFACPAPVEVDGVVSRRAGIGVVARAIRLLNLD